MINFREAGNPLLMACVLLVLRGAPTECTENQFQIRPLLASLKKCVGKSTLTQIILERHTVSADYRKATWRNASIAQGANLSSSPSAIISMSLVLKIRGAAPTSRVLLSSNCFNLSNHNDARTTSSGRKRNTRLWYDHPFGKTIGARCRGNRSSSVVLHLCVSLVTCKLQPSEYVLRCNVAERNINTCGPTRK